MSFDVEKDIFAEHDYGKVALRKLAPVGPTFRLFCAEWLGKTPADWKTMKVQGCDFRVAKRGPNKGKLSIPIPGTTREAYVTREEMAAQRKKDEKKKAMSA